MVLLLQSINTLVLSEIINFLNFLAFGVNALKI